jgi:hypothetical protein
MPAFALAFTSALGLLVGPAPSRGPALHTARSAHVRLCAPDAGDLQLREAASRVVAAAAQFGSEQAEAAAAWVDQALTAGGAARDGTDLLETQLTIFEECLVDYDDDDGPAKCQELDDALASLERHLMAAASTTPAEPVFAVFDNSKLDRACTRVRTAASKFGPEQTKVTEAWLAEVRKKRTSPTGLLESQAALFDECLLDEDGSSSRCREMEESLTALQASLGIAGKIVSTRDLLPKPVERSE